MAVCIREMFLKEYMIFLNQFQTMIISVQVICYLNIILNINMDIIYNKMYHDKIYNQII